MDNLKYRYVANSNRLDYITDGVASSTFTTDIDNQLSGAYRYDGNGNVQSDTSRGIALIVYDIDNLPVSEYRTDGTVIQYAYDGIGTRVREELWDLHTHGTLAVRIRKQKFSTVIRPRTRHTIFGEETTLGR